MLGPVLFIAYVNDIIELLTCKMSKFDDDKKITWKATTADEKKQLQSDLDRLVNWPSKWQFKYNVDRCNVLPMGSRNDCSNYSLSASDLLKVKAEKTW